MSGHAIKVENLSFRYDGAKEEALKNINFTVNYGEIVGIVGRNSAGKTTLAMALNNLIPSMIDGDIEGKIIVDGKEISQLSVAELSSTIGYVFQEPENQISQMTVEEEVAFGLGNMGLASSEMPERINEALETVGLVGFNKRSPLNLSGGQQQRLVIASVLAMKPKILIMDEPTSMLDPIGKNEVYGVLAKLKAENMTGIIIDHEMERIAMYCDKVLVLDSGELIEFDRPKEVFKKVNLLENLKLRAPQVSTITYYLNEKYKQDIDIPITNEEALEIYRKYHFN